MNQDQANEWAHSNSPEYFKDFMREFASDMERLVEECSEIIETGCGLIDGRSVPGQGRDIYLILAGDPYDFGMDIYDEPGGLGFMVSNPVVLEDFSQCREPMVIKIMPGTSNQYVINALRECINRIESSGHDEFPLLNAKEKPIVKGDIPF